MASPGRGEEHTTPTGHKRILGAGPAAAGHLRRGAGKAAPPAAAAGRSAAATRWPGPGRHLRGTGTERPGAVGASPSRRAGPPAPQAGTGEGEDEDSGGCPCASRQAATLPFSAVLCCPADHGSHVHREFYIFGCLQGEGGKLRESSGLLTPARLPKSSKNWKYRAAALRASHRSRVRNCTSGRAASV